jgi:hypothetical protein
VDQVSLLSKSAVEKLTLGLDGSKPLPVGSLILGDRTDEGRHRLEAELERACDLLHWAPICDLLRECYAPGATFAGAFGRLLTKVFAAYGLIVMDAATADFHSLGAPTLRAAIEHADELEAGLLARTQELESAGYHAQVLITPGHSLLFLIDAETGARQPLRRTAPAAGAPAGWKAGARLYTPADLLAILDAEPERLSPNALLRPVFQDTILPTAVRSRLSADSGPHHAVAAASLGHAGRASSRRHARRAGGQLPADPRSQDHRSPGPAARRARHAY